MTDFTETIEATAESVEDLQEDLEAHLEDIFGVDVDVETPALDAGGGDRPHILDAWVAFPGAKEELEERLGADEVDRCEMKIQLSVGDPE